MPPQNPTRPGTDEPHLFPLPRRIHGFDPRRRFGHLVVERLDPDLPDEGFAVDVDHDTAVLRHRDAAGLRHGRRIVEQLRDGSGRLPAIHLEDDPDFAVRGFMLDISRDRVPTRDTLDRLVTVLELCRFNHLQLYVEHTYAYIDHRDVWADASPIDADDLRWLRRRCHDAGIELAANQNTFGHFGRWLAHERYRGRAECPDGFELLPGLRLPPTTLAPTPENADLALSLVREQVAAADARIVNIGCDETFELGRGASRIRTEREGRTAVYLEHLRRLVDPLRADGLHVQFWADVIARDPAALEHLPAEGTTALVWNYDAPDTPVPVIPDHLAKPLASIGIDPTAPTDFASRLEPFTEHGVRHWVVPGTSTWNSLVGRLDNARANLNDAARAGRASGADGFLVTDWGDNGHHQPLTVSYPAIVHGGAVAWGIDANERTDAARVIDEHLLIDQNRIVGRILEEIGGVSNRTGIVTQNAGALFTALFPHVFALRSGSPDPDLVHDVSTVLDRAAAALPRARIGLDGADAITAELAVTIDLARFAAESLTEPPDPPANRRRERADRLTALIERYRTAWSATSRPGGLDDSTAHLRKTRARLHGDDP